MRLHRPLFLFSATALALALASSAESQIPQPVDPAQYSYSTTIEIWHGWMNLTPCSKVEWRNDGPFGTPSPTYVQGPQELHGYIRANVVSSSEEAISNVKARIVNCGARGAAAAGVTALLTGGPGSWEAFQATFNSCISETALSDIVGGYNFSTESKCVW